MALRIGLALILLSAVACTTVGTRSTPHIHYEQFERSEVLAADYENEKIDVDLTLNATYPIFSDSPDSRELNLWVRDAIEASETYFGKPISSRRSEVSERRWAEVGVDCEVGKVSEALVSFRCRRTLLGNLIPHELRNDTVFTFRRSASGELSPIHFQDLFPAEEADSMLVQFIREEWCRTDASVIPGDRICGLDAKTEEAWARECVGSPFLGESGVEFSSYRYPNAFEATISYCNLYVVLSAEFRRLLCP